MFVLPATISISLDACIIIFFLRQPLRFGGDPDGPFAPFSGGYHPLGSSVEDVVALACLRLLFFLPLVWSFYRGHRVSMLLPILWESLNLCLLAAKTSTFAACHHDWDSQWVLILVSALSAGAQCFCIDHLRSSAASRALEKKHVFLRAAVRAMGGEAFGRRGGRSHSRSNSMDEEDGRSTDRLSSNGGGTDHEGESRRFLADWAGKMSQMQERWGKRVDATVERLEEMAGRQSAEQLLSPMPLLVKLFAHQDPPDDNNRVFDQLEQAFAMDPEAFEFLLPQYVLFLLYASFGSSQRLERFLLDKSAQNIHLAHRLHWFLVAFCLSGAGISPVGVDAITQMLRELARRGETPAALLAEGMGPGEEGSRLVRGRPPSVYLEAFVRMPGGGNGGGGGGSAFGAVTADGGGGGIGSCRLSSSLAVAEIGGSGSRMSAPDRVRSLAVGSAGPTGRSFPGPNTGLGPLGGGGSDRSSFTAAVRRGFPAASFPAGGSFAAAPAFVEALCGVARELVAVPRERRTEELRRRLRRVDEEHLPGRAVYVPVGNRRHRVFRIHLEESFAFSTKDRAPFLATLEVVDYDRPPDSATSAAARRHRSSSGGATAGLAAWARDTPLVRGLQRVASTGFQRTFRLGNKEFTVRLGDPDHSPDGTPAGGGGGPNASGGGGGGGGRGSPAVSVSSVMTDSVAGSPAIDRWHAGPPPPLHPYSPSGSDFSSGVYYVPLAGRALGGSSSASPDTVTGLSNGSGGGAGGRIGWQAPGGGPGGGGRRPRHGSSGMAQESLVSLDAIGLGQHTKSLGMWSSPNLRRESVDDAALGMTVGRSRSVGLDLDMAGRRARALSDPPPGRFGVPLPALLSGSGGRVGHGGGGVAANSGGGGDDGTVGSDAGLGDHEERWSMADSEVTPSPTPRSLMRRGVTGMTAFGDAGGGAGSGIGGGLRHAALMGGNGNDGGGGEMDSRNGGIREGATSATAVVAVAVAAAPTPPLSSRRLSFGGLAFLRPKSAAAAAGGSSGGGGASVGGEKIPLLRRIRQSPSASSAQAAAGSSSAAAPSTAPAPLRPEQSLPRPMSAGAAAAVSGGGGGGASSGDRISSWAVAVDAYSDTRDGGGNGYGGYGGGYGGYGLHGCDNSADEDDSFRMRTGSTGSEGDLRGVADAASAAPAAPPRVIFREKWRQKEHRLRRLSKVGHLRGWRLVPVIVKSGDDLRQEQVASQLLHQFHRILCEAQASEGLEAWLRPYDIVATSPDSGIIEAVPDTVSLDALKKNDPHYTTLTDFFERHFGYGDAGGGGGSGGGSGGSDGVSGGGGGFSAEGFATARARFVESLAAYCVTTYLLQVKDRHNGNILLDAHGHVIHIDFGFMLANSPGGNFNFESAPFKLTGEFVELMDGPNSECFKRFRTLCVQTFLVLRQQMDKITLLAEMCSVGNGHLPCFAGRPDRVVDELRRRFRPEMHDRAAREYVHALIDRSMSSWRTSFYDKYQQLVVGIR